MSETYDVVIVGAGFTGATCAARLVAMGKRVCVVDSRDIVGGTSADRINEIGSLVPEFGPHAFHTSSKRVWEYLNSFAEFKSYVQISKTWYRGEYYDIPINANTIEKFFNKKFKNQAECEKFLRTKLITPTSVDDSQGLAYSIMGPELFSAFYKNYTLKQWNLEARQLSRVVLGRLPVRTDRDNRYFTDEYQGIPLLGYSDLIARMLDGADVHVNTIVTLEEAATVGDHVIWTGALDDAFKQCYGPLPWRSLRFQQIYADFAQDYSVIHEAEINPTHTRTMDSSYFNGLATNGQTTLLREWSSEVGEKFYPILRLDDALKDILHKYSFRAANTNQVTMLGRLGRFKYLNMDQAISDALHYCDQQEKRVIA